MINTVVLPIGNTNTVVLPTTEELQWIFTTESTRSRCTFYVLLKVHLDMIVWRITNLMHNLFSVHFVNLYMFRAYLDPSSGGTTVCIQQLTLIILFRWLSVVLDGIQMTVCCSGWNPDDCLFSGMESRWPSVFLDGFQMTVCCPGWNPDDCLLSWMESRWPSVILDGFKMTVCCPRWNPVDCLLSWMDSRWLSVVLDGFQMTVCCPGWNPDDFLLSIRWVGGWVSVYR
jgi:hypothetical protein